MKILLKWSEWNECVNSRRDDVIGLNEALADSFVKLKYIAFIDNFFEFIPRNKNFYEFIWINYIGLDISLSKMNFLNNLKDA